MRFFRAGHAHAQAVGNVARDVALDLRDVGQLAGIMGTPNLGAIGRIDQVRLHTHLVATLGDAPNQHGAHLQPLANLARIFLAALEAKHGAARHDFHVGQLRERADQAFGQTVAQILIAAIGGCVDERKNRNRADLTRFRFCNEACRRRQPRLPAARPRRFRPITNLRDRPRPAARPTTPELAEAAEMLLAEALDERPESRSRFSRARSVRRSAAVW